MNLINYLTNMACWLRIYTRIIYGSKYTLPHVSCVECIRSDSHAHCLGTFTTSYKVFLLFINRPISQ